VARRPLEREGLYLDGGRRTTQLMRDSLGGITNKLSWREDRMRWRIPIACTILSLCITTQLPGQARFEPNTANPPAGKTTQLVAVLISSSHCIGNQYPGFLTSVDSMNRSLATRAKTQGLWFIAVGVSTDWAPDSGMTYLRSLSAFNEVTVGDNWFNLGVAHYVLPDSLGHLSVPQVLLIQRDFTSEERSFQFGPDRIISRHVGAQDIVRWVNDGTPLP
jgi:hypothetical protein